MTFGVCYDTLAERLADATRSIPSDNAGPIVWRSYIETRLEYAGCTQIAQISRVGPIGFCGPSWAVGWGNVHRYPQPTARAITMMDQAHGWIFHCIPDLRARQIVGRRSLVQPDSDSDAPRYVWPWVRLVEADGLVKSGPNVEATKRRWIAGIDRIVAQIATSRSASDPAPGIRCSSRDPLAPNTSNIAGLLRARVIA